jgi:hypothetical protein
MVMPSVALITVVVHRSWGPAAQRRLTKEQPRTCSNPDRRTGALRRVLRDEMACRGCRRKRCTHMATGGFVAALVAISPVGLFDL